ncbi:MAG: permease prefix domain 1-containing protein [Eubacteriales bacterium]|nr:permease prefix domain 1-containing protein [Eubacteriales bacterium]
METIRTYLDNMFLQLPDTPEVRRAKEELLGMMEDKYFELKSQGKSENEAIGMVIADFGNMDEIVKELGLQEIPREETGGPEGLFLSMDEVKDYVSGMGTCARMIGVGVTLCIWSPILFFFLGGLSESLGGRMEGPLGFVGFAFMLVMIAAAVGIFILYGTRIDKYQYLKKAVIHMDVPTEVMVRQGKEQHKATFTMQLVVGVALCIISVLPLLAVGMMFEDNDLLGCIALCILLFLVGIAVFLFVDGGVGGECYKVLLQEEEFAPSRKKKSHKAKKKAMERISSVYWGVITCVYLIWSFQTMMWWKTWLIWPVAGVLYAAIEGVIKGLIGYDD